MKLAACQRLIQKIDFRTVHNSNENKIGSYAMDNHGRNKRRKFWSLNSSAFPGTSFHTGWWSNEHDICLTPNQLSYSMVVQLIYYVPNSKESSYGFKASRH
jgi:hypothetical protein